MLFFSLLKSECGKWGLIRTNIFCESTYKPVLADFVAITLSFSAKQLIVFILQHEPEGQKIYSKYHKPYSQDENSSDKNEEW